MTHTGFFERFFITPFIRRYSDFHGSESKRNALISFLAWLIVTSGVIGVLLGFVGLLGPEVGFVCLYVIGGLWIAGSVCPLAALISRTSKPEEGNHNHPVRFLGIDKFLTVVCVLFLILGILMTVTTLNSGEINPYHRGNGDRGGNPILEQDEVFEEPIFTYQDETPAIVEDVLDEEEEVTDTISLDESFDPVIATDISLDTLAIE